MKLRMLDALLRMKTNLSFEKKCYKNFTVTEKFLDLFDEKQRNANLIAIEDHAVSPR